MKLLFSICCLLLTVPFFAQVKVSGMVIDKETKEPLIYANILVLEPQTKAGLEGTTSDLDGKFDLSVADSSFILAISYTGYKTIEKSVVDVLQNPQVDLTPETVVDGIEVIGYRVPLVEQDNTTQGQILTSVELKVLRKQTRKGRKDANGNGLYVMGSRTANLQYQVQPANTEDYDLIQENRFHKVTDEPQSTFSINVDAASYSNIMRRFLNQQELPPKDAVRIEELINYFEYEYAEPIDDQPFSINTEVANCPWVEEHKLLHIGLQGKSIPTDDLPPSNLVFLFDVSGSMQSHDKLPLLKSSFSLLTNQLHPQDRVAIVVYAGSSGLVLPSTPGNKKADILEAIERLEAGGSTAGAAGIELAYKVAQENFQDGGNNRVLDSSNICCPYLIRTFYH